MHLGAHSVDVGRLYATQRILGVIGVIWAALSGLFLVFGGARKLSQPAWRPLLETTHTVSTVPVDQCYLVVGAVLLTGGILGVIGLMITERWVSLLSATICALWCSTVAGFLGMSNVNVAAGGNFVAVSVAMNALVFLIRFFLLSRSPQPDRAVQLYERG